LQSEQLLNFTAPAGCGSSVKPAIYIAPSYPFVSLLDPAIPLTASNDTYSYNRPSFANSTIHFLGELPPYSTVLQAPNVQIQKVLLEGSNFNNVSLCNVISYASNSSAK
jgi:hypothetical protein